MRNIVSYIPAGAFASGNVVKGTLHLTICPWDCVDKVEFPFAVRVP